MSSGQNAALHAGLEPSTQTRGKEGASMAGQERHPMGLLNANVAGGIGAGQTAEEGEGREI